MSQQNASNLHQCQLTIDGRPYSFPLEGQLQAGEGGVLFHELPPVFSREPLASQGFEVIELLEPAAVDRLTEACRQNLFRIFHEVGISAPADFALTQYHEVVATSQQHQQVITQTKLLTYNDLDLDAESICQTVGQHLGCRLQALIPDLGTPVIHLRISRPQSMDINPLHRDAYLPYYRNTVNLWLPIAGCDAHSSLPVLPGSHLWPEADLVKTPNGGARIQGLPYHVPGIVQARQPLALIRPNPGAGQALVFTPTLIHGAAVNENAAATRLSLELRLYILPD